MGLVTIFNRKVLIKDLVIAGIIVVLPFLFYLYMFAPNEKVWETWFFTIESNYYRDVNTFLWAISTKVLMLAILLLWFFTCKHWWKYCILIPIIIELYKLLGTIKPNLTFIDENEFIKSLPFTIPILILLIYLSNRLNYYSLVQKLNINLDEEIDNLIQELAKYKSIDYKSKRDQYEELKKIKSNLDKMEYLKRLISLRNELLSE